MRYLIIDTETSGLFDFKKPADAEGQPRLASICGVVLGDDLRLINISHWYVKPDGWTMPAEAEDINGLDQGFLEKLGHPVDEILTWYEETLSCVDCLVAYNVQYDSKVMRGELRRAGRDDKFEDTPTLCVMKAAASYLGGKWPRLEEACRKFDIGLHAGHTAVGDVMAAIEIMKKLKEKGALPEPSVKYAKARPADILDIL
jgi:DNA polymerase III epsilon subunit-like protein